MNVRKVVAGLAHIANLIGWFMLTSKMYYSGEWSLTKAGLACMLSALCVSGVITVLYYYSKYNGGGGKGTW